MRVGITGSNGFIGSNLVQKLKKEKIPYSVFDKTKHNLFFPETLKGFVDKCDIIVHLAGKNIDTNENIINVNTLGTASLIAAMNKYSPKARIIFISSFQAYSEKSLYGLSKRLAEELIEYYSKYYGLKGTILRLSNVYGQGCKPYYNSVIATFIDLISKNKPLNVNGDGSQKRDYLHVDDVVNAILMSLTVRENKIRCVDICSGKLTSLKEIVKMLEEICGKKTNVNFKTSVFSEEESRIKNYKEANKAFGWSPKITLMEGLKRTFESSI